MKKRFIFLLSILFAISLFFLIPGYLINTPFVSHFIHKTISDNIPGTIFWSRHSISLFDNTIKLKDAVILDDKGDSVIAVENLNARVSFILLFKREINFTYINAYNANVFLCLKNNGNLNVVNAFVSSGKPDKGSSNKESLEIKLNNISIKNSLFRYKDSSSNIDVRIKAVDLTGNYDVFGFKGNANLQTGKASLISDFPVMLDSIYLSAKVNEDKIQNIVIKLLKEQDNISLVGNLDNLYNKEKIRGNLKLNLNITPSNFFNVIPVLDSLSGSLEVDLVHSGLLNDPNINSTVNYSASDLDDLPIDSFKSAISIKDKEITFKTLNVSGPSNSHINSSGIVSLSGAFSNGFLERVDNVENITYDFNFRFNIPRVSTVIKEDINKSLKEIEGELNIAGRGVTLDSISTQASLNCRSRISFSEKFVDWVELKSSLGIKCGQLSSDTKFSNKYMGTSKIIGEYNFSKKNLKGYIKNFKFDTKLLADLYHLNTDGVFTVNSDFRGRLNDLNVNYSLRSNNINLWDNPIDSVILIGDYNSSAGIVSGDLSLFTNAGYLYVNNRLECFEKGSFSVLEKPIIKTNVNTYLSSVSSFSKNTIEGDLKAEGSFNGTLDSGVGEIQITSEELKSEYLSIKNSRASVQYDHGALLVRDFISHLPGGYLSLLGEFDRDNYYKFESKGVLNLDSLEYLKKYRASGILNLEASGDGEIKNLVSKLSVNVINPKVMGERLDSLAISATLIGGGVDFNIASNFLSHGRYDLENRSYSLHTTLNSTDFVPFIMPDKSDLWRGAVSGYSFVKGEGTSIDSIVLDLYNFNLKYDTLDLASSEAISFYYGGGSLFIKNMNIDLIDEGSIICKGGFSQKGSGNVMGSFHLPYSAIQYVSDEIKNGSGFIDFNLMLNGDIKRPNVNGSFKSSKGGFVLGESGQKVKSLTFNGSFTDKSLNINDGSLKLDGGDVTFSGNLNSNNRTIDSSEINLQIGMSKVPIVVPDMADFIISGNVDVNAKNSIGKATGDIKLFDGIYYKDIEMNLFNKKVKRINDLYSEKNSNIINDIALDIQIIPYSTVSVDNNVAFLDVLPEVSLKGDIGKPIVEGRAEVKDGFITFRNREFQIKKGVLDFTDPYSNNPFVYLEAEIEKDKWKVIISVEGKTGEDMNFKLSSIPSLSDQEVVSLLLIGKPEISGIEDAIAAAGTLAGEYLDNTAGKINALFTLPIDKVSLESKDLNEGITVNVEQYISRYLSTIYSVNMKNGDASRKAELLLKLFDNFSAKGFTETTGKRGFELEAGFGKP